MSSGREHGKTVFQTEWLTDKRFKLWLGPGKKSNEATCRHHHNSTINVEKMGCTLSYAKEKKQKAIADSYPLASSLSSFSANPSAQKTCMVRKETCFT